MRWQFFVSSTHNLSLLVKVVMFHVYFKSEFLFCKFKLPNRHLFILYIFSNSSEIWLSVLCLLCLKYLKFYDFSFSFLVLTLQGSQTCKMFSFVYFEAFQWTPNHSHSIINAYVSIYSWGVWVTSLSAGDWMIKNCR